MTVQSKPWRPALAGAIGIALGGFAIWQTPGMSELGRVFPFTSGLIAIAAGVGVLLQAVLQTVAAQPSGKEEVDFARAGSFALILLVWALLLDPVGFVPTSAVAMVCIAVVTRREPMSLRAIVFHAIAGAVLVLGFSYLLSEVLNVRLP